MTIDEFLRWQSYFKLKPTGPMAWLEVQIASLLALTENINKKKGAAKAKPKKYMMKREKPPQTTEQAGQAMRAWYTAMGGNSGN